MRILKWVLGIVVSFGLVIVLGGFLLPREIQVARSVQIDAQPADVFPHVNSLKATEAWSPWMDRDPNIQTTYSGPEDGVGAKLEWASDHPQVGNGSQAIMTSIENERVETVLDFGEMGTSKAAFILTEKSGTTEITWTLDTDMGANPVGRWMGLMMDKWVGADYEAGLTNLKNLIEN
ncbi:MAG: SRPBCC family protein [Paracoccaceae bacterium]